MTFLKRILVKARTESKGLKFSDVVKSYAFESEVSKSIEDWLETFGSMHYLINHGPYKKWSLLKFDPQKVVPHHNSQDKGHMDDMRKVKNPDEMPPIILDPDNMTIDGAHRGRVAKEEKWPFVWAWVPHPDSKMSEEDIAYLLDGDVDNETIAERIEEF